MMLCLLTSNSSSDEHSLPLNGSTSALLQSTTTKVYVSCLLILVPLFAVLGNLLIVVSVARFRNLRTPTNAFVVSLVMADFLVAVLVMPFSLVRSVDQWRFGRNFCIAHILMDMTLCTSSIFNLSCVALDRYVAVCDPLHYSARMSSKIIVLLLILCWILPLLISSLIVSLDMYSKPELTSQSQQVCVAAFQTPYAAVGSTLSFFIPAGFLVFAYGRIFLVAQRQVRWIHAMKHQAEQLQDLSPTLNQRSTIEDPGPARLNQVPSRADQSGQLQNSGPRLDQPGHPCSMRKERKAAKTLGLIMGVFLLCWLPFVCVNMAQPLWGYSINPLVLEVVMWLTYANSSINPFIYASNTHFQRAFAAILGCGMLGRHLRTCLESSQRRVRLTIALETISKQVHSEPVVPQ